MSTAELISIIIMGLALLSTLLGWIACLIRGDIKKDVLIWMEEAEKRGGTGEDKLKYVINKVCNKYKVFKFILDVKAFIEKIIKFSKNVNNKGGK